MFNLPKSTEFNQRVPKQEIYEHAKKRVKISTALQKKFAEQVETICWQNKISVDTTNLAAGNYVTEIEIFELKLRAEPIDEKILRLIDKAISSYKIIFVLSRNGLYRACAAYKNESISKNYFYTDRFSEDESPIALQGLTLDDAYENFIRQIAGKSLQGIPGETFSDVINRFNKILLIERKMKTLSRKMCSEKQFNRQLEMNGQLKIWQNEVERLRSGSDGRQVGGRLA